MPFIQCAIQIPTFADVDEFEEAMDKSVMTMVHKAAKEFVAVATKSVPKRTGFAAGSLGNVLKAVGSTLGAAKLKDLGAFGRLLQLQQEVALQKGQDLLLQGIDSSGFARKEYYYPSGGRRVLKTPTSGMQFGTPIDKIIKRSGHQVTFQYQVNISYYSIQDVRAQRSPTSPWRSFLRGGEAFIKVMEQLASDINNYPSIEGFIEVNTTTVNASGSKSTTKKVLVR